MTEETSDNRQEIRRPERRYAAVALTGYCLLGFLLFALFDCGLRLADGYLNFFDPYQSPNKSLVFWAVKHFRQEKEPPDIVLLGSSLMMVAHHAGDATYLNSIQNEVFHHRSSVLEGMWKKRTHRDVSAFSFAIAGQMVSDAYVLTFSLLRNERKPKAIVYGIAPRDFIDNTLPSPASTETYRYAERFADLSKIESEARPSLFERVDLLLSKLSYIYSHRNDFIAAQKTVLTAVLYPRTSAADRQRIECPWKLRQLALLQFPEDNGTNELMIAPYGLHHEPYKDNSEEYRQRYARVKEKTYDCQLSFFKKLLGYCRDEGIQLSVVNMPLTRDNIALMPPGFYSDYLRKVSSLSSLYGAQFLDMNKEPSFTRECFADSVHLNGLGGVTFFRRLCDELSRNSHLAAIGREHQ